MIGYKRKLKACGDYVLLVISHEAMKPYYLTLLGIVITGLAMGNTACYIIEAFKYG